MLGVVVVCDDKEVIATVQLGHKVGAIMRMARAKFVNYCARRASSRPAAAPAGPLPRRRSPCLIINFDDIQSMTIMTLLQPYWHSPSQGRTVTGKEVVFYSFDTKFHCYLSY